MLLAIPNQSDETAATNVTDNKKEVPITRRLVCLSSLYYDKERLAWDANENAAGSGLKNAYLKCFDACQSFLSALVF